MRFIRIVLVLSLLSGCSNVKSEKSNPELMQLYTSFIDNLYNSDYQLIKYITREGETDTIRMDSINWDQELKLFTELNISKSHLGNYNITVSKNGCEKIFQTNSKKCPIKRYKYLLCENNLNVCIDFEKSSPLYLFSYHLELNNKGYLIKIISDVKMSYASKYRIERKFFTNENKTH